MVDLWQALALIAAGGLVSLISGVVIQRKTVSANRESEERQAKRRVEEEQRQAIRQIRRERIQPIVDFIESSKRRYASQIVDDSLRELVDNLPEELRSQKRSELAEFKRSAPSMLEISRLFLVASASSASIPGLHNELSAILGGPGTDPEIAGKWGLAVASAEELIERYIVSANPSPIRPAGIPSQEAVSGPTVEKT